MSTNWFSFEKLREEIKEDELFEITQSCVITSTCEVEVDDFQDFLKEYSAKFPKKSRFYFLTGTHGKKSGEFGETDSSQRGDIINRFMAMKANISKDKTVQEREYRFHIESVGNVVGQDVEDVNFPTLRTIMEDMLESQHPYIVILAYCYSNKSELLDMLIQSGVVAVQNAKMERARITEGECFLLDTHQQCIFAKVNNDHMKDTLINCQCKNLFLYGSHGTGKTVINKIVLRMRISYYLKRLEANQILNVIIGVYHSNADTLLEELKIEFQDLNKNPKLNVQFEHYDIE